MIAVSVSDVSPVVCYGIIINTTITSNQHYLCWLAQCTRQLIVLFALNIMKQNGVRPLAKFLHIFKFFRPSDVAISFTLATSSIESPRRSASYIFVVSALMLGSVNPAGRGRPPLTASSASVSIRACRALVTVCTGTPNRFKVN